VDAVLDGRYDPVVETQVFRRLGLHDGDAGAQDAGIADAGAGLHPECLGFVTRRDAAGCFCHHRRHPHRPAAQRRIKVLLDRCEVRIAINEQGCQRTLHNGYECTGMVPG